MIIRTPPELIRAIVSGAAATDGRVCIATDNSFRIRYDALRFTTEGDDGVITLMYRGRVQGVARVTDYLKIKNVAMFMLTLPLVCEAPLSFKDISE